MIFERDHENRQVAAPVFVREGGLHEDVTGGLVANAAHFGAMLVENAAVIVGDFDDGVVGGEAERAVRDPTVLGQVHLQRNAVADHHWLEFV